MTLQQSRHERVNNIHSVNCVDFCLLCYRVQSLWRGKLCCGSRSRRIRGGYRPPCPPAPKGSTIWTTWTLWTFLSALGPRTSPPTALICLLQVGAPFRAAQQLRKQSEGVGGAGDNGSKESKGRIIGAKESKGGLIEAKESKWGLIGARSRRGE